MNRHLKRGGIALCGLAVVAGGYYAWFTHRPQPRTVSFALGEGATYSRFVQADPPCIFHVIEIDLKKSPAFQTTEGNPNQKLPFLATTTSDWAKATDVDIAISADFHEPWHSNGILDYYPHVGDPVNTYGLSKNRGRVVSQGTKGTGPTLFLTKDRVSFKSFDKEESAVSGDITILAQGTLNPTISSDYHLDREPRMVAGTDRSGTKLYLVAVDGRQPNYSEGISLPDLGKWLAAHGVASAVNLDGGGSVTMVAKVGGKLETLNCPIDKRIIGRERAVANHLGITLLKSR